MKPMYPNGAHIFHSLRPPRRHGGVSSFSPWSSSVGVPHIRVPSQLGLTGSDACKVIQRTPEDTNSKRELDIFRASF